MKDADKKRIEHMLAAISDIQSFYGNANRDAKTQAAIERKIEIIGEAARAISDSLRQQYPDIPWMNIIGMRNYLVHEYFRIDDGTIWTTVEHKIPALKNWLEGIIDNEKKNRPTPATQ